MKQVTMESVKQRIADLESAGKVVGGLSLSSEFELACLRELVAVTEQRDAVMVEAAQMRKIIDSVTDLDNEPQYHEQGMGCGLEDRNITDRYKAMRYGWEEAMERVYGEVIPCAEELSFPATDAAIAELRAEGVDMLAESYEAAAKDSDDFKFINHCNIKADQAREFARQLRESKGANHEA